MAIIETKDLTKIYSVGRRQVVGLDHATFQIEEGEIFGILGPNGSGKTTCLKLLLGILFPTSGEALIMGQPPDSVEMKMHVGFLPENPYYYDYLSGAEILRFFGRLYGLSGPEFERRIAELLDLVGLSEAGRLALRHYSKGMLERIGLAACLVNDAKVLILDEPTTGLDPIGCKETRDLLVQLKAQGKTILLSSHFLSEVERVCDRIAIFHRGHLLTTGSLSGLIQQYQASNLEDLFVKTIQEYDSQHPMGKEPA